MPTKHMKHLKHALATWGSPGPGDSNHRCRSQRRAREPPIASSTELGSGGRVARVTGGSEQHRMGVRRPDGKATTGEGRHVGEGQRRTGGAVDAPTAVTCVRQWEKKMSLCF